MDEKDPFGKDRRKAAKEVKSLTAQIKAIQAKSPEYQMAEATKRVAAAHARVSAAKEKYKALMSRPAVGSREYYEAKAAGAKKAGNLEKMRSYEKHAAAAKPSPKRDIEPWNKKEVAGLIENLPKRPVGKKDEKEQQSLETGSRGGRFYINKEGKKTYVK